MVDRIISYFLLERPVMGGQGIKREVILFTGVVAGTFGRWLVAVIDQGQFSVTGPVLGLMAAIVTFPAIWENAGLKELEQINFVKWCVGFQNGYFWPALLEQVGKAMTPP